MARQFIFLLGLLIFTITGCSLYSINSEEVTSNYYPPKGSTQEVEYAETITRPHEIIGFVTVNAERNQKMQDVIEKIKREAAILGGDAITNITSNASGSWKKVPPKRLLGNAYVRTNFTATVVAYK